MTRKQAFVQERPDVVSGLWKFDARLSPRSQEVLLKIAIEWIEEEPDRYLQMYVRMCSKDQIGIGFAYKLDGPDYKKSKERFFHKVTDQLKRQFGNDFVGWDMACPTWLVGTVDAV